MKILAISDIHNNVACVRKLRSQEENDFDVIAIAGDIGSHRAEKIFGVLNTFNCPIVYVYGNWDGGLPYYKNFGPNSRLVHLNVVEVGSIAFTGFSDVDLGRDPLMTLPANLPRVQRVDRYRDALLEVIAQAGIDIRRTVIMTHERLTRLGQRLPGVLLCLFGHNHVFDVSESKGTTYVNPSALDRTLAVMPTRGNPHLRRQVLAPSERRWLPQIGELRYVNAGNYAVIQVGETGNIDIECRLLKHAYEGWTVVDNPHYFGAPLVPEEAIFGDNARFPDPDD